jgi:hypothetical protein
LEVEKGPKVRICSVGLIEQLKQNSLYAVEEERLARLEAEQEAAAAAEERLRCQLCSVRAGTRLQLLEHYSGQHLAADLATSFADLGMSKAMNDHKKQIQYFGSYSCN